MGDEKLYKKTANWAKDNPVTGVPSRKRETGASTQREKGKQVERE